jgi:hypothetical protein
MSFLIIHGIIEMMFKIIFEGDKNMATLEYIRVVLADSSIATIPARAIVGKDGCILHSAQQVATASTDELAQMRENLRRYNSGE